MITIKSIMVSDIFNSSNKKELFDAYEEESKVKEIGVSVNAIEDRYIELEDANVLHSVGVYKDDTMVGFLTMLYSVMPHYNELSATVESQFILKEHRKYGTGKKMIEFATNKAKNDGCINMFFPASVGSRLDKIANSLGFSQTHVVYSKDLLLEN